MSPLPEQLTIGELASRSGVAASALRFYEEIGLVEAERTSSNHRRYRRSALRRVSVIRAAQAVGLSLAQVSQALSTLPANRQASKRDWERLSKHWHHDLETRIAELEKLRDNLASCIGCGCLSLESCALFNPGDRAAGRGDGPRFLLGDPVAKDLGSS